MGYLLLFLSSVIFFLFALRLYPRMKYKLPPGPLPLPVIGNLHNLEEHMSPCLERMSLKYGDILSVWVGTNLTIVVFSSSLAREVLKENDKELANRLLTAPVDVMFHHGIGLVWSNFGPYYSKLRKFITHELFSPKRVEALRAGREEEMAAMVRSIARDMNGNKSLVVRKYVHVVIFNFLTTLVLGEKLIDENGNIDERGLELEELVREEAKLAFALFPAETIWWLSWVVGIKRRDFKKHMARRERYVKSFLEERRKTADEGSPHLVDSLLSLGSAHHLRDEDVTALIWDMLNTGMDTGTIAAECTMAALVRNPDVQAKLQEELDRVIQPGDAVSELDVHILPYLRCVVKESLRLYPPSPLMVPHRAASTVKIGGYDVPAGASIIVDVKATGRDPAVWKDPLEFRPERFLEEDVDYRGSDFRLLPFGAGRRMCPAAVLSFNMVAAMVGRLVHGFSWSPPHGVVASEIDMTGNPGVTEYLKTPLEAVPTMRLRGQMYKL